MTATQMPAAMMFQAMRDHPVQGSWPSEVSQASPGEQHAFSSVGGTVGGSSVG